MDYAAVQYYLNDLPPNFLRQGTVFTQWQNSLTLGITRWTSAIDGVMAQVNFNNAKWTWLNTWGQLYGVQRPANFTDSAYRTLIQKTLLARGATPVTIQYYLSWGYGVTSQIKEDFTNTSWNIYLSSPLPNATTETYNQLAANLGRFRPAGVPFSPFYIPYGGFYISTINFVGVTRVPGSWLTSATLAQGFSLAEGTTNSVSGLPTTFLIDPTLNPSLAAAPVPVPLSVFSTPNNTPPSSTVLGSDAYTNFSIVASDPNGALAGSSGDKAFDTSTSTLYICTASGTTSSAVWTAIA